MKFLCHLPLITALALFGGVSAHAQSFSEGFNDVSNLPAGWVVQNNSDRNSTGNPWSTGNAIFDDDNNSTVLPHEGDGFAIANYSSVGSGTGTISNWLISPTFNLENGDTFSFFTTTTPDSGYADRLEVRLSLAGVSTDVGTTADSIGDFATVLLAINPTLAVGGYPENWTQYTATISGLSAPTMGRVAFRYDVTGGGPTGTNSNIIGVEDVDFSAVPEPSTYALFGGALIVFGAVTFGRRRPDVMTPCQARLGKRPSE